MAKKIPRKNLSKTITNPRPDAERRVRQADRLGRILRVLNLIQGRGRFNAKEIAAENECTERTVHRDLAALELAGVPYYFDKEQKCYRVRPGWQFPVLNLTPDELLGQAVAKAVTSSPGLNAGGGAGPATQKLSAKSSTETQKLLEDADQLITVLDLKLADHSSHQETIKTIQWALLEQKQLTGQYQSPYQDKPIKLTLHPYRLCLVQQAWYLVARPAEEEVAKTYRAIRFKSLRTTGDAAEVPESFNLREYFGNAWAVTRGAKSYEVAIQFTPDAAPLVTETNWHPTQEVTRHKDGGATLRFQVDGLDEIVWWVLGWSGRAKVEGPEELRRKVLEQLERAMQLNSTGQ